MADKPAGCWLERIHKSASLAWLTLLPLNVLECIAKRNVEPYSLVQKGRELGNLGIGGLPRLGVPLCKVRISGWNESYLGYIGGLADVAAPAFDNLVKAILPKLALTILQTGIFVVR